MNEATFKTGIAYLSKLYGKVDSELVIGYWNILKGYSDEQFKTMIENIVKSFIPTSQVPFPLPPHFLQNFGLSGKNRIQLAINAVKNAISKTGPYKSISFGDRALHATIIEFGGWPEMCSWDLTKWEYNEKRFKECYEAELTNNSGPDYVMGLCELVNSEKMHLFNEKQKEYALREQKIMSIEWRGYRELLPDNTKTTMKIEKKKNGDLQKINELLEY